MKLIISLSLVLLSLAGYSQEDELILVKKSRIEFCMGKAEQVNILMIRLDTLGAEIKLLETRIKTKDSDADLWKQAAKTWQVEADSYKVKFVTTDFLLEDSKLKNKALKKQNTGLKIGIVLIISAVVYDKVNN